MCRPDIEYTVNKLDFCIIFENNVKSCKTTGYTDANYAGCPKSSMVCWKSSLALVLRSFDLVLIDWILSVASAGRILRLFLGGWTLSLALVGWIVLMSCLNNLNPLPLDWHLDEVLLLALPKKDGWGGLAGGLQAMQVVVFRLMGEKNAGGSINGHLPCCWKGAL